MARIAAERAGVHDGRGEQADPRRPRQQALPHRPHRDVGDGADPDQPAAERGLDRRARHRALGRFDLGRGDRAAAIASPRARPSPAATNRRRARRASTSSARDDRPDAVGEPGRAQRRRRQLDQRTRRPAAARRASARPRRGASSHPASTGAPAAPPRPRSSRWSAPAPVAMPPRAVATRRSRTPTSRVIGILRDPGDGGPTGGRPGQTRAGWTVPAEARGPRPEAFGWVALIQKSAARHGLRAII